MATSPENVLTTMMRTGSTVSPTDTFSGNITRCDTLTYDYDIATSVICGMCFLFGIVYCFFGYRCFKAVMFLTGFIFGSVIVFMLCNEERFYTTYLSVEASAGIAIGIGVLCGLVTMLINAVGLFMTGFTLGMFLSAALLIVLEAFYHPPTVWIPVGIIFGVGILFAVLTLQWQKSCTILATSVFGGAIMTVCVDYFVEHFIMVQYVWERFMAALSEPVCWYSWVILSIWPVLMVIGVVVQHRVTGRNFDHQEASRSRRHYSRTETREPSQEGDDVVENSRQQRDVVVVISRKKRRVHLYRIRQQDARVRQRHMMEERYRQYQDLYRPVRRFHGDIITQNYLQSLQNKSPGPQTPTSQTPTSIEPETPPAQLETYTPVRGANVMPSAPVVAV
ncbi:TMEM198 [Branchiostoma lanceolatum]|uniref:Transmembrane protein 198 n=1 Tax=Branchiostoma lanceolatum TaxID=7740 RepID=A0A8J9VQY3_BRALA|nr:TMEM198 [Branchiostoma lanceolatum]